jgi:hypothetical protein
MNGSFQNPWDPEGRYYSGLRGPVSGLPWYKDRPSPDDPTLFVKNNGVPVHDAVERGDLKQVKRYLEEEKFLPNSVYRESAVWRGCVSGRYELIYYVSLIGLAARGGHVEIISYLLEKKADFQINRNDGRAFCPLSEAVMRCNKRVTILLLEAGISINNQDHQYRTPLINAVHCNLLDMASFLIERKADINFAPPGVKKLDRNLTALHLAAVNGNNQIYSLLIEHKADVSKTVLGPSHYEYKHDVIDLAVQYRRSEFLKFIYDKKFDHVSYGGDQNFPWTDDGQKFFDQTCNQLGLFRSARRGNKPWIDNLLGSQDRPLCILISMVRMKKDGIAFSLSISAIPYYWHAPR